MVTMTMDAVLCDELLEEILRRLPPSSSSSVSLVSKRWLFLHRSSTTSLSLRIPSSPFPPSIANNSGMSAAAAAAAAAAAMVADILSHYPFLSSLTVASSGHDGRPPPAAPPPPSSSDDYLLVVAAAACSRRLSHLRFHSADSPLSPSALLSASYSLRRLTSLHISALLPLSFRWLRRFPCLTSLSLVRSRAKQLSGQESGEEEEEEEEDDEEEEEDDDDDREDEDGRQILALPLESLSLSGIRSTDRGLSWLWRRCGGLRRLQLRACDGTGPPSSFALCLAGLLCLELRTCRAVADRVLHQAAEHCRALTTLLLYDGGSRDALRQFIRRRGAALRVLDLRLPLDLHNDHLFAIAAGDDNPTPHHRIAAGPGMRGLSALRLQSCCLVTGDGLRSLARSPAAAAIEELALVNCDVVEREPGLLTFLGQSMPGLRRLDLSHNELLPDKEVASMLASCRNLLDIRLRGCKSLTGASLLSLLRHCGRVLEAVDVSNCLGVSAHAVEIFILNATRLDRITVEEGKLSDAARAFASRKAIKTS